MSVVFEKAIVVGASSGIGEAIARELAAAGAQVAILGRRLPELERVASAFPERLRPCVHDVSDLDGVPACFERTVGELGGLDTLVYAAGILHRVDDSEYDFQKDRETITVNLLGAMAWMNLAAARFQAAGAGTLLGISSVAGERGRRGNPAYGTSKAAFTAYLEALRNRCSRDGVNVVTVKPGYIDTAMVRGTKGLFWVVSPEVAARQSLSLARRGSSASGFVPRRWGPVAMALRLVPSFIFRRLKV